MPFDGTLNPVIQLLDEAKNIIIRCGWAKGQWMGPCGQVCAYRALTHAAQSNPMGADTADKVFSLATGGTKNFPRYHIPQWNDDPERTLQDILDAFDHAKMIALALLD